MKKILFIIERNLYYKFHGPIINQCIDAGHKVYLIHRNIQTPFNLKNQKMFYYPFLSQAPTFNSKPEKVISFASNADMTRIIVTNGIDYVFSLLSRGHYGLSKGKEIWCTIQHGIDSFKESSFESDYLFVYSKNWIVDDFEGQIKDCQVVECGHYYVEEDKLDRDIILEKYNLSQDKKYLFFIPLPVNEGSSYTFIKGKLRRRIIIRFLLKQELLILDYLNKELKKLDIEIIIKSRFKRFLSKKYYDKAHIFYDDSFYNSSINELIYVADSVLLNFMPSGSTTETLSLKKNYSFINYPFLSDEIFPHTDTYIENIFLPNGKNKNIVNYKNLAAIVTAIKNDMAEPFRKSDFFEKYLWPKGLEGARTILDALKL